MWGLVWLHTQVVGLECDVKTVQCFLRWVEEDPGVVDEQINSWADELNINGKLVDRGEIVEVQEAAKHVGVPRLGSDPLLNGLPLLKLPGCEDDRSSSFCKLGGNR